MVRSPGQGQTPAINGHDNAVNQAANLLYVAGVSEDELSVIDATTGQQVTTAPAGAAPVGDTYFRRAIYESNAFGPDVWVISTPA